MSTHAYITSTGTFLPGPAIDNDTMESVLGLVGDKPSRYRKKILRSNGIESRHYALDQNGTPTHLSEEMAALAIQAAINASDLTLNDLKMIAVGTTIPDILAPGIASMVHGRLGHRPMDILSCHGICGAGAAAIKSAWLNVVANQHDAVVAAAVERPSPILRGRNFEKESELAVAKPGDNGEYAYFNADFLRWMLSDGAGAMLIENRPAKNTMSLRIDWIETLSYAHELPVCMTLGCNKGGDIQLENTWTYSIDRPDANYDKFLLRQDTRLLEAGIRTAVINTLYHCIEKHQYDIKTVDHFLPHISSFFFKKLFLEGLDAIGLSIPEEKWFTNLKTKGNIGAASIFVMLDEALRTQRFKHNECILLMVPESGRFSASYIHLTCIDSQ